MRIPGHLENFIELMAAKIAPYSGAAENYTSADGMLGASSERSQAEEPVGDDTAFEALHASDLTARRDALMGGIIPEGRNTIAGRTRRSAQSIRAEGRSGPASGSHIWLAQQRQWTQQPQSSQRYPSDEWLRDPASSASYHRAGGERQPHSAQEDSVESGHPSTPTSARDHPGARLSRRPIPSAPEPTTRALQKRLGRVDSGDSALTRRSRRLWSRMSSAVSWLPLMVSRKLRGLRRWVSSRRAEWSGGVQSPPDATQQQEHQQDPPDPALVDRRLCKCGAPPRKRYRNVLVSSGLGQFLSTSFWIPALGLVYLLGLSRYGCAGEGLWGEMVVLSFV